jgi:hypothetical protein
MFGPAHTPAPLLLALVALLACAGPAAGAPAPQAAPREGAVAADAGAEPGEGRAVLLRFARAVEAGRWSEAWPLLSERWRSATSPARLAADFRAAGPVAREAAERVVALLGSGAALASGPGEGAERLSLRVGPGRSARLVREPGGWRVDALE